MAQGWGVGTWGTDKWGGIATYGVTVADTNAVAATETAVTNYGQAAVVESVGLSTLDGGAASFNVALAESSAAGSAEMGAATFSTPIAESIAIAETETVATTFLNIVIEFAALAEVTTVGSMYFISVDEVTTADTSEAATTDYTGLQVDETVEATAIDAGGATFVKALIETATLAISLKAQTSYHEARIETLTAAEAEAIRLQWELINDSRPTNWQNIGTASAPNWQNVNNAAASNWQPIAT